MIFELNMLLRGYQVAAALVILESWPIIKSAITIIISIKSLMDLRNFAIDIKAETEGVWLPCGDAQLKIGRLNSPAYKEAFAKAARPFSALAKAGILKDQDARNIVAEALAKTVLLDWKNLKLDGVELPYSQAKAQELLSNPEFDSFVKLVNDLAENEANFRQEEISKEMGEPENISSGS